MPHSPLAAKSNALLNQRYCSQEIQEQWIKRFDIDVSRFFSENEIVEWLCPVSGLRFFEPDSLAGDSPFYAALSEFPWYYMEWKWEHRVACRFLRPGTRLLEVGCGRGSFVARVANEKHVDALGIELNQQSVEEAKALGRNVEFRDLAELSKTEAGRFDVVCFFEVLEHVPNPREFLEQCLACLRPGGQLLIAVPNNDSFIKKARLNLLNLPPHHMGLWSLEVFKSLEKLLPVKLETWRREPLAEYHCDWYLNQMASELGGPRKRLFYRFRGAIRFALLKLGLRRMITGHTLFVSLRHRP